MGRGGRIQSSAGGASEKQVAAASASYAKQLQAIVKRLSTALEDDPSCQQQKTQQLWQQALEKKTSSVRLRERDCLAVIKAIRKVRVMAKKNELLNSFISIWINAIQLEKRQRQARWRLQKDLLFADLSNPFAHAAFGLWVNVANGEGCEVQSSQRAVLQLMQDALERVKVLSKHLQTGQKFSGEISWQMQLTGLVPRFGKLCWVLGNIARRQRLAKTTLTALLTICDSFCQVTQQLSAREIRLCPQMNEMMAHFFRVIPNIVAQSEKKAVERRSKQPQAAINAYGQVFTSLIAEKKAALFEKLAEWLLKNKSQQVMADILNKGYVFDKMVKQATSQREIKESKGAVIKKRATVKQAPAFHAIALKWVLRFSDNPFVRLTPHVILPESANTLEKKLYARYARHLNRARRGELRALTPPREEKKGCAEDKLADQHRAYCAEVKRAILKHVPEWDAKAYALHGLIDGVRQQIVLMEQEEPRRTVQAMNSLYSEGQRLYQRATTLFSQLDRADTMPASRFPDTGTAREKISVEESLTQLPLQPDEAWLNELKAPFMLQQQGRSVLEIARAYLEKQRQLLQRIKDWLPQKSRQLVFPRILKRALDDTLLMARWLWHDTNVMALRPLMQHDIDVLKARMGLLQNYSAQLLIWFKTDALQYASENRVSRLRSEIDTIVPGIDGLVEQGASLPEDSQAGKNVVKLRLWKEKPKLIVEANYLHIWPAKREATTKNKTVYCFAYKDKTGSVKGTFETPLSSTEQCKANQLAKACKDSREGMRFCGNEFREHLPALRFWVLKKTGYRQPLRRDNRHRTALHCAAQLWADEDKKQRDRIKAEEEKKREEEAKAAQERKKNKWRLRLQEIREEKQKKAGELKKENQKKTDESKKEEAQAESKENKELVDKVKSSSEPFWHLIKVFAAKNPDALDRALFESVDGQRTPVEILQQVEFSEEEQLQLLARYQRYVLKTATEAYTGDIEHGLENPTKFTGVFGAIKNWIVTHCPVWLSKHCYQHGEPGVRRAKTVWASMQAACCRFEIMTKGAPNRTARKRVIAGQRIIFAKEQKNALLRWVGIGKRSVWGVYACDQAGKVTRQVLRQLHHQTMDALVEDREQDTVNGVVEDRETITRLDAITRRYGVARTKIESRVVDGVFIRALCEKRGNTLTRSYKTVLQKTLYQTRTAAVLFKNNTMQRLARRQFGPCIRDEDPSPEQRTRDEDCRIRAVKTRLEAFNTLREEMRLAGRF